MISLIILLIIIAALAARTGMLAQKNPSGNIWLIILGIVMLLPGLCGSFFLVVSFLDSGSSVEARSYAMVFTSIAVPSIQLSCLLLWLIARKSDVVWFRMLTHNLGWFAAATALILFVQYVQMAIEDRGTVWDKATTAGFGLLIAGLPFLIGGFLALRLKVKDGEKS